MAAVYEEVKRRRSPAPKGASAIRHQTCITGEMTVEDIKIAGAEIRQTKATALAFLQSAGLLDKNGNLAKPYRD